MRNNLIYLFLAGLVLPIFLFNSWSIDPVPGKAPPPPGGSIFLPFINGSDPFVQLPTLQATNTQQSLSSTSTPSPTSTRTLTPVSPIPTATRTITPVPPTPTSSSTPTRTATATSTSTPTALPGKSLQFPIRAAFYEAGYPELWGNNGASLHYHPADGLYSSSSVDTIHRQIQAMQYGNVQAGIINWDGPQSLSDSRVSTILSATHHAGYNNFFWALDYEAESQGNPPADLVNKDLAYILNHYASDPNYLRVNGRFVLFVSGSSAETCELTTRWHQANQGINAFLVLKVFGGYAACPDQPDSWHQYSPASREDQQRGFSFSISPGFWLPSENTPRLIRDLNAWNQAVRDMQSAKTDWQLVTTFNDWIDSSAVENATEWQSASGYGTYLDALHNNGILPPVPTPTPTQTPTETAPFVIRAAGDLTRCGGRPVTETNTAWIVPGMLLNTTGPVFSLGDNSNDAGSEDDYANCVDPTWGQLYDRLYPAMGNHDQIADPQGGPFFAYFGDKAGTYGHYSLNLGGWHIVVLNSDCAVGAQGCNPTSPQVQWLQADLAANPNRCTLAIFHTPYFTSGSQSAYTAMLNFWNVLYQNHVDVILNGHNHLYERFAPQDPLGNLDTLNGIREFVVGTGGASVDSTTKLPLPNEEVRDWSAFGYLQMSLWPDHYDWKFVQQPGKTFTDSGTSACH